MSIRVGILGCGKIARLHALGYQTASDLAQVVVCCDEYSIELAQKMHEIWPIRTRMESAIDSIAQGFPEAKQAQIKAAMRKSMKYDQLEEGSVKAMAETFTEEELEEMIKFYGSETGRSISAKTGMYEDALRPIMMEMIDKAMLDIRTGQKP